MATLRGLAALILGIAFLWLTIPGSLAFTLANGEPDYALQLAPNNSAALAAAADVELFSAADVNQIKFVEARARKALLGSPLTIDALRDLAFLDELRGRKTVAERAFKLAGRLSLRDFPTHFWLFTAASDHQDYAAILREADILLNQDDQTWPALIPMLVKLQDSPSPLRAMIAAQLIRRNPIWRGSFLEALGKSGDLDAAFATYHDLKKAGVPPSPSEVNPYFRRAASTMRAAQIYEQWRALTGAGPSTQMLRDGDFDGANTPFPFGWDLRTDGGNYGEIAADPTGRFGKALHLVFSDPTSQLASQGVVLTPGAYHLNGEIYVDGAADGKSVRVSLLCSLDDTGNPILVIALPANGPNWTHFAVPFAVGADCPGQRLSIEGQSDDTLQPASAWIDRLAITRD